MGIFDEIYRNARESSNKHTAEELRSFCLQVSKEIQTSFSSFSSDDMPPSAMKRFNKVFYICANDSIKDFHVLNPNSSQAICSWQELSDSTGLVYYGTMLKSGGSIRPHSFGQLYYRSALGLLNYDGYFENGVPAGKCSLYVKDNSGKAYERDGNIRAYQNRDSGSIEFAFY
ncbi:MAG: hypothetical protein AAF609_19485 [Cyanobacteria bacterium P01_C01_bin.120]